jgi:branched-chain amino acid transport system permease protein
LVADRRINAQRNLAGVLLGRPPRVALGGAALLAAGTLPLWLNTVNLYTAGQAVVFAVLGVGLMVSLGVCRQANFGITPYFAFGAYGAADISVRWHLGAVGALLAVTAVSGIAGYLIGRIILRLRQFTLALATFVLATAVWEYLEVGFPQSLGGGDNGLVLPTLSVFGYSIFGNAGYYLALASLVVTIAVLALVMRTRIGRALHALGQDATAAQTSGIDVTHYGALGYAISAAIAATAGALFLYTVGAITPGGFDVGVNVTVLLMVVLGGLSTLAGPVIGAAFIVVLNQKLESALSYSVLIDGLVLLAVVRFLPDGLAGQFVRWADHLRSVLSGEPRDPRSDSLDPAAPDPLATGSGG